MRRPEVTNELIIETGNKLKSSNTKVTGYSLSKEIGRGRPDRLYEIWVQYEAEQNLSEEADPLLSPELENAVENLLSTIKSDIHKTLSSCESLMRTQAERCIEREKVTFLDQLGLLENKLKDADSVINQNEDRIELLQNEIQQNESYKSQIIELDKSILEATIKLEALTQTIKDKEHIITEQAARIEDLK